MDQKLYFPHFSPLLQFEIISGLILSVSSCWDMRLNPGSGVTAFDVMFSIELVQTT